MTDEFNFSDVARTAALNDLDYTLGAVDPELDALVALAAKACGASAAAISLLDGEHFVRIAISDGVTRDGPGKGQKVRVIARTAFAMRAMITGQTLAVADARADPEWASNVQVSKPPFIRSYVGTPIGPTTNLPLGVIGVVHTQPNVFGPREIELLESIAEPVRLHLNTRLVSVRSARAAEKTESERSRQMRFEQIFQSISEGVNVYSTDGIIVESNPAASALLGLTNEQQQGRAYVDPRWRIVATDGSSVSPENFPIARLLRTGEATDNTVIGVDLPNGARRWLSINAVPVRDQKTGELAFGAVTFKDVTVELQALESLKYESVRLKEALAATERASQAKTDFLSVMSHELRTPMNAVIGCAALLRQSDLKGTQGRTLGVLEDASRQMLALLNDLFDLSTLDNGKVRLTCEPTNLVRLIEDAAVIWAADVRAKGLSLAVMIDPKLVAPRSVDPGRVLQIIGNLMANAIKFTAEGHVQIQAWPARSRNGVDMVAIEVEDTGPGVPPEAASRIFSPFEQVDVSTKRRHGGLGIGLYVARRLANAMGGDIELDSRTGEGSRFTARLEAPLAIIDRDGDADDRTKLEMPTRSVLCVDDNPRNLYVLGAVLKAAGHEVIECASGPEALEVLALRKVDIILLDMVMPEMDGLDVLARLKTEPGPNAETPVVACTANVLPDQVKAYVGAGTAAVIAKPINVAEVLKVVSAIAA